MAASPIPAPSPPGAASQATGEAGIARTGHPERRPDLLTLVLDSLPNQDTRRHYGRACLEFARWRAEQGHVLADPEVLAAWRNHLKEQGLMPRTINQKLAAVRKLVERAVAYGLMPAAHAAAIRATKNARELGNRSGNWLSQAQAQALIEAPSPSTLKGKRDRAALALLVGCGLRREEAVGLRFEDIQQRDGRWVIPDLRGKHGRIRTVPVPAWVKDALDRWQAAAEIHSGTILRGMDRHGHITHDSLSGQAVFNLAAQYGSTIGVRIGAHDLRRTCAKLCRKHGGELEQIQMLLGHASVQTTERYLGTKQDLENAPNDHLGLKWRHEWTS